MFVNEIKARAFILATCGVSAGRVVSSFDNRVEFELPPGTDTHEVLNTIGNELQKPFTTETVGVGQKLHTIDMGYGRAFFVKETDKGVSVGLQQVFKASDNLLTAIHAVWQAIAEEGLDVSDNEEAIELVLDADRLETMGGKEGETATEELDALTEIYGQPKVDKELAKLVNFV